MEDFAFCVRQWQGLKGADYYKQRLPRCHGKVAMEDAIIALTANQAMHGLESDEKGEKKKPRPERIEFKEEWFDANNLAAVPDAGTKQKIPV